MGNCLKVWFEQSESRFSECNRHVVALNAAIEAVELRWCSTSLRFVFMVQFDVHYELLDEVVLVCLF